MDTEVLPSALFSPSKARQQRAQAQDWQHVDAWLSSKYPGRAVPDFERNGDVLKALLALVAANERADEEQSMVAQVEREALSELEAKVNEPCFDSSTLCGAMASGSFTGKSDVESSDLEILHTITENLTVQGKQSLEAIAGLSVALDVPGTDAEMLAHSIINLRDTSESLSQHLDRLNDLYTYLEDELAEARTLLAEVQSPVFTASSSLPRQTVEWTRNTKHLRTKLLEYTDRLSALNQSATPSSVPVQDVAKQEEQILALRGKVTELEAQVQTFKGLPQDWEAAKRSVQSAQKELERLRLRRDELFADLVEA